MEGTVTDIVAAAGDWFREHGLAVLIILVVVLVLHAAGRRLIGKAVRKAEKVDSLLPLDAEIEGKRQETLVRIFEGLFTVVLWTVAPLMMLSQAGIAIGPLLAAAGAAGLAVGFGAQYLIHDLISGIFIILENQYRVGDYIMVGGIGGEVEDISLRKTTLRDLDGVVHHVPHSEIKIVSNRTRSFSRVNIDVSVSYATDIDVAAAVIDRVGREMAADPDWQEELIEPPAFARVEELGDSGVILKVIGDTRPGVQLRVAGELRKRIKQAFDAEGIEIPFPQIVVHRGKGAAGDD